MFVILPLDNSQTSRFCNRTKNIPEAEEVLHFLLAGFVGDTLDVDSGRHGVDVLCDGLGGCRYLSMERFVMERKILLDRDVMCHGVYFITKPAQLRSNRTQCKHVTAVSIAGHPSRLRHVPTTPAATACNHEPGVDVFGGIYSFSCQQA